MACRYCKAQMRCSECGGSEDDDETAAWRPNMWAVVVAFWTTTLGTLTGLAGEKSPSMQVLAMVFVVVLALGPMSLAGLAILAV